MLPLLMAATVLASVPAAVQAAGNPDKAAAFYEDALVRFNRADYAGAVIQLKNTLQQDSRMLAAHLLLARSLIQMGELSTAEVALVTASSLGVARSEIAPLMARALYGQAKFQQVIERVQPTDLPAAARLEVLVLRGSAYSELGDNQAAARSLDEARSLDPNSVAVLLADSSLQLKLRRVDAALALTDKALSIAPANADAWAAKAGVLLAQRQVPEALAAYGRALAAEPKHIEARLARATVLLDAGQDAPAKADIDELGKLSPDDPRVAMLRANLAARRGEGSAVQLALGEVVATIDPMSPESRARRPQLLMLGGTAHYGLGNMQKAREYLEILVRQQPFNVGAIKLLASASLIAGEPARALTLLDSIRPNARNDASFLILTANAHLALKHYQRAAQLYQEAAQLGAGDSPDVMANLGLSLVGMGKTAAAAQQMQAAFARSPGDARTGMALATIYLKERQSKQAVGVLEQVAARNPRNPLAFNMLGVAQGAAGNFPAARQAYEKALSVDPKLNAARLNLARLDAAEGKRDSARNRLNELLKVEPNNLDAMFELAQLDEAAGRLPDAIRWLEKARAIDSRGTRPALALAEILLRNGQPAQALEATRSALSAQPENLTVMAAHVRAQLANQDLTGARTTLSSMTRLAEYDADLQVEIARLQLAAENPTGAGYSLAKALSAKPEHFEALVLQADSALRGGETAQAEQYGKTLVARYPDKAAGYHVLGDVAASRGQTAVALAQHRSALTREPGVESALRVWRAHLVAREPAKGLVFLQEWLRKYPDPRLKAAISEGQMMTGDWKSARTTLEGLIREVGESPNLVNNLAVVLVRLQDPAAVSTAEKAYRTSPNTPMFMDTYGWALARAGRHDQALRLLRDARLRAPQSDEIRYHLAWTLAAAGRKAEARDEIGAVLKDGRSFDSLADARVLATELGR
ncbi:XrtA/PEP-CTERM system TPR-repeat protein PrsT [Uliginosibacterium sp. H1]|uniref:XrtA/PEP-CTERM system TPR-repeat protein PrsT n=1 Tax=Uliginosibacterium sp. H1 TaxID=3114757 RepID=UPI002E19283A|nr:XrtA/PEP-CTERM system TPR-repeat protein PrsT [Uliginosibacterium sp. H1]